MELLLSRYQLKWHGSCKYQFCLCGIQWLLFGLQFWFYDNHLRRISDSRCSCCYHVASYWQTQNSCLYS